MIRRDFMEELFTQDQVVARSSQTPYRTIREPIRSQPTTRITASLLSAAAASVFVLGSVWSTSGCTAVQTIPDHEERALLILEVEPGSTEIYIDSEYRGVVDGWTGNAVPIEPGYHRLELRADGRMTRRFDIEARAGEQVELRVVMEPELDDTL